MFNSKYSKVLTVILVIAIIGIIGVLVVLGIDYYKKYTTTSDADSAISEFDGYINNIIANNQTNNTDINNDVTPDIDGNTLVPDTNSQAGDNTSNSSSSGLNYKGFEVVGKIEIPKTNVKLPVLAKVTPKSIEASVGVLYGPGINQVGNTVIIGHNFRNGTFFSNNKKLAVGDKIYLTDMQGNKVTYTITKKYTTGTDDFDYATRDTNGKREISLSTCTDDTKSRLIIWAAEN